MGYISDALRVIVGEVFGLAISEPGALLGVALDVYRVSVFERDVWGWRLDEAVLEARFGGVSVDVGVGGDCRLEVYGFVPVGEAGEEYSLAGGNAGAGLLGALGMGRRCGGSFPAVLGGGNVAWAVGEVFRGSIGWYNAFNVFLEGGRVELRGDGWRLEYGDGLVSLVAGCSGKRGSYRVVYGRRGEDASGLLSEEECLVASEDVARYVDESKLAIVSGWKRVPSDLVRVVSKVAGMAEESPERLIMEADEVELYEDYDKATGKWRFSGLYIGLVYGSTSVTVFVDAARNVKVEAERSVEKGEEWGEAFNVLDSRVGEKILGLLGLSV
jgi:hypothetical protein